MKAKDLMIGDWVYIHHGGKATHYGKVTALLPFGAIESEIDGSHALSSSVEPIPITPEILEKNGFIYKDAAHNNFRGVWVCNVGRCNNVFIQFTDKVAIEIHNELGRKDEKGRADLVSFCRDWCEVLFVHELQHALRLCGIEKEIVL